MAGTFNYDSSEEMLVGFLKTTNIKEECTDNQSLHDISKKTMVHDLWMIEIPK